MSSICILGVGSPHGDDQAGWLVIDRLRRLVGSEYLAAKMKAVSTPADIPALLEGGEELLIVDACRGAGDLGKIQHFTHPDARIEQLVPRFGHGMTLHQSIELAATLGSTPKSCEIWCIEGADFRPQAVVSPFVSRSADRLVDLCVQWLTSRGALHA